MLFARANRDRFQLTDTTNNQKKPMRYFSTERISIGNRFGRSNTQKIWSRKQVDLCHFARTLNNQDFRTRMVPNYLHIFVAGNRPPAFWRGLLRLRALKCITQSLHLIATTAALKMIVDQPHGLHESINGGRTNKGPAALFEILGNAR